MINKKEILIGIVCIALLCLSFFIYRNNYKEKQRINNNYKALQQELVQYKLKDSSNVAEITALRIDKSTLENIFEEQAEEIKQLNIRLKDVKNYSKIGTTTYITINDTIHDSIIVVNDYLDTIKCVNVDDPWFKLRGCTEDNIFRGDVLIIDSITVITSIEKKKFLWWRYGYKRSKTTVRSANPYTEINEVKNIIIE